MGLDVFIYVPHRTKIITEFCWNCSLMYSFNIIILCYLYLPIFIYLAVLTF